MALDINDVIRDQSKKPPNKAKKDLSVTRKRMRKPWHVGEDLLGTSPSLSEKKPPSSSSQNKGTELVQTGTKNSSNARKKTPHKTGTTKVQIKKISKKNPKPNKLVRTGTENPNKGTKLVQTGTELVQPNIKTSINQKPIQTLTSTEKVQISTKLVQPLTTSLEFESTRTFNTPQNKGTELVQTGTKTPHTEPTLPHNTGTEIGTKNSSSESKLVQTGTPYTYKGTQTGTELSQTHVNTGTELVQPNRYQRFSEMYGMKRQVMAFIYKNLQLNFSDITSPITLEHMAEGCQSSKNTVRKAAQRLENEGVLVRASFKRGAGGWTRYSLPREIRLDIHAEFVSQNTGTKLGQNWDKTKPVPSTEVETTPSSSSGGFNNLTTTTKQDDSWTSLAIPPEMVDSGFSLTHLKQLQTRVGDWLSPEDVLESMEHFAFDLREKRLNVRTSPIRLFMGVLVKQKLKYQSEAILEAEMEDLRAYTDRINRLKEEKFNFDEIEEQKEFENWREQFEESILKNMVAPTSLMPFGSKRYEVLLKTYWKSNHKKQ